MKTIKEANLMEGMGVYSTIFGEGRVVMLMDGKYKYFINVHFKSGLEMAYDEHGRHDDCQIHPDLYEGTRHPWLLIL